MRRTALVAAAAGPLLLALCAAPVASAADSGAKIGVRTVSVGHPGNRSVGIVPFSDAIYRTCKKAPATAQGCLMVGKVDRRYRIGELEVTVAQWVRFLNRVDPSGRNKQRLYDPTESSGQWPKYGQINRKSHARPGHHYRVSLPAWRNKPYGFATFLRAARFANALTNGTVVRKSVRNHVGYRVTTYSVILSRRTTRGMYDLRDRGTTRTKRSGFVIPSQDEWIKAAYFDPRGGGTYEYWKYPTNAGVFGDNTATAPASTTLNPTTGAVANASTQPLANYHASGLPAPTWCPKAFSSTTCSSVNPFGLDPNAYAKAYQGSLGSIGQAKTRSPWGTLDQGGNAVEWTDTITPPPSGRSNGRVWRRLHGGVPNAPVYQLWLSAVGLQPQDNAFYAHTYPWLGFRIGVIGRVDLWPRRAAGARLGGEGRV